jgi:hypothetical protein
VDTEDIDRLDLKVGSLELDVSLSLASRVDIADLGNNPSEGEGSIRTGENVFVHTTHQLHVSERKTKELTRDPS